MYRVYQVWNSSNDSLVGYAMSREMSSLSDVYEVLDDKIHIIMYLASQGKAVTAIGVGTREALEACAPQKFGLSSQL